MENLVKKVAYLQGLMAGMQLEANSNEGRMLRAVVDVLEDMADAIMEIRTDYDDLASQVDSIDDDLSDLEEEVFEEEDDDEDEDDFVEVECPNCHEWVSFEADILEDEDEIEVTCPNCGAVVFNNDEEYDLTAGEEGEAVLSRAGDDDDL